MPSLASALVGSSPLTRGKHQVVLVPLSKIRLIPAHAGKTATRPPRLYRRGAHPRSRGENVRTAQYSPPAGGSSPLTRGKPWRRGRKHGVVRLIPAHAGKTSTPVTVVVSQPAHPRSRGENSTLGEPVTIHRGSSPLTRGKRRQDPRCPSCPGLIPAHAGKTGGVVGVVASRMAHPRSRGENRDVRGRH